MILPQIKKKHCKIASINKNKYVIGFIRITEEFSYSLLPNITHLPPITFYNMDSSQQNKNKCGTHSSN